MNTEDIIKFENNGGNELHLFRDRLFWQAWEHSAFLFSKIFRKYKVHHRFVQKVAQDLVWLGFPENRTCMQFARKIKKSRGDKL